MTRATDELASDSKPTLGFLLKWIGIFIGLAIVALVGVGLVLPRQWEVEVERTIEASPETVHALVSDVEQWHRWMFDPAAEAAGMTVEASGQGVGATVSWSGGGSTGEMHLVESTLESGIRWDGKIETDEVNNHGSITYAVADGQVTVTLRDTGELPPVLGGFFVPVMNSGLRQHFEGALGRLEATAEGEVEGDAAPAAPE